MKSFKIASVLLLLFVFIGRQNLTAQTVNKLKPPLIIGLGWSIVDDDGKPFKKLFSFRQSWNVLPYPTRITVDRVLRRGLSNELIAVYSKYKPGKTINNEVIASSGLFISVDLMLKYHFNEYFKIKKRFDIYAAIGIGGTFRTIAKRKITPTFNIGLGLTTWIYPRLGINVQSLAKFGIQSPIIKTSSNYLHHSIGLVYKLGGKKPRKEGSVVKPRYPWVHRKHKGSERTK